MVDTNNIIFFTYPAYNLNGHEVEEVNQELVKLLRNHFNCKVNVSAKDKYRLVMTLDIKDNEWNDHRVALIAITESLMELQKSKRKLV